MNRKTRMLKRDLYKSKDTYKRDLNKSKDTSKRDLNTSKDTYTREVHASNRKMRMKETCIQGNTE